MLNWVSNFFYRIADRRLSVRFFLLELVFLIVIWPWCERWIGLPESKTRLLDVCFGFTPDMAYQMLNSYGDPGRHRYAVATLLVDGVYPLVYTGLLVFLLTILLSGIFSESSRWRMLNLWPLAALAADYAENAGIFILLTNFPDRLDGVAVWASIAGMAKWTAVISALVLLILLAVKRLYNRIINNH